MNDKTELKECYNYNRKNIEQKWIHKWNKSMYFFDWYDSKKPQYIIDTPPPYPTGVFHIGNALNWCYIDFLARYKRMNGYNVMFPQGWDCHGLPTEVKVEELYNITKNQISRGEFKEKCRELTIQNIQNMKKTMIQLAFSIDWNNEFITMEKKYYKNTQKSFLEMLKKNLIYHEEHPVNWCPRCETAIALAEVEYIEKKSKLNYIYFKLKDSNDKIVVATSRPELLCSCVAVLVNDKDERYKKYLNKIVIVPYYDNLVPIISDSSVDINFGTGIVMVCTFGDKQDIKWVKKYKLNILKPIDKKGFMTSLAGKYSGMSVIECRKSIINDLMNTGELYNQKDIVQNVGVCWRCKSEIEILSEIQWFIKIDKEKILEKIDLIKWTPEYMKVRIKNWIDTMEWDWCISRQRIFATPIPVWYCSNCKNIILPNEEDLPINPIEQLPNIHCSNCGSAEFIGDTDVLDTWMDSSITELYISKWNTENYRKLPVHIRQQGHDIIRTWAFYTIVRSLALEEEIPWKEIIINGMVLGIDGHKMSKSIGNIISPDNIIEKHGVDAFRQWAALGGTMGSDIIFQWKDVIASSRFILKLWNIYKLIHSNIKDFDILNIENINNEYNKLKDIDKWMLSKLYDLMISVTDLMNNYKYDECMKTIRDFTWNLLASDYIELIKGRLYNTKNIYRSGAQYTLSFILLTICKLLAPFMPYITEEIFYNFLNKSIHLEKWPSFENKINTFSNSDIQKIIYNSQYQMNILKKIRKYKKDNNYTLNYNLKKIEIYNLKDKYLDLDDLINATNSNITINSNKLILEKIPVKKVFDLKVLGPLYKDKTNEVINHIKNIPNESLFNIDGNLKINSITIDDCEYQIPKDSIKIIYNYKLENKTIDIINIDDILLVIEK